MHTVVVSKNKIKLADSHLTYIVGTSINVKVIGVAIMTKMEVFEHFANNLWSHSA